MKRNILLHINDKLKRNSGNNLQNLDKTPNPSDTSSDNAGLPNYIFLTTSSSQNHLLWYVEVIIFNLVDSFNQGNPN